MTDDRAHPPAPTPPGMDPRGLVLGTRLGEVRCVKFSPDDQMAAVCAGSRVLLLDVQVRGGRGQRGHSAGGLQGLAGKLLIERVSVDVRV